MGHRGGSQYRGLLTRRLKAGGLLVMVLLTGCSSSAGGVTGAANSGGSGSSSGIQQVDRAHRGTPIQVSGTLLTGQSWSTADAVGKVVVLNVWGSWCPPCQAELPTLQKAWTQLHTAGTPVVLMGQDYQESPATALATVKERGLSYPSLRDDNGRTVLALGRYFAGPPTTVVLDTQHRVAAVITGPIDQATLVGLVDDTVAGQ